MVRLMLAMVAAALALAGQTAADLHFKKAGVCGRCHVISVVEWGLSGHSKADTDCVACHGASQGHVVDERNNIKPERLPRAPGPPTTGGHRSVRFRHARRYAMDQGRDDSARTAR